MSFIPAKDCFEIAKAFFEIAIRFSIIANCLYKTANDLSIIAIHYFSFATNIFIIAKHFFINQLLYLKKDQRMFNLRLATFEFQSRNLLVLGAGCTVYRLYVRFNIHCYIDKTAVFFVKYLVPCNTGVA
jgi:hypothetical protein